MSAAAAARYNRILRMGLHGIEAVARNGRRIRHTNRSSIEPAAVR
jgi:hypothetical protein